MVRTAALLFAALVLATSSLTACTTYRSELHRGQRYYEENKYETALALWRALEPNQDSLSAAERVRYAYFRGMTDYRLGFRSDARYWLSLARAGEQLHPASLPHASLERLDATLTDLNEDLVGAGEPEQSARPAAATAATCDWSTECASGHLCENGVCIEL